jgi:pilus assembly protein Flp/PilA
VHRPGGQGQANLKGGESPVLLNTIQRVLSVVRRDDEGQGLAEYALILALIAIVAIVALIFLGSQISSKLSIVGNAM